jgi:hypothetical protein
MKTAVTIKKDISPIWVKVIGSMIFLATIYKIVSLTFLDVSLHTYLIMNLIATAIWTGKKIVVIDINKMEIGEGFGFFGIVHLDKYKFSGLEKIFINRVNTAETFTHLARTIDIHHDNYKAFLKTVDGEKICIREHTDKEILIAELMSYNVVLKTAIFDTSLAEPIQLA